MRIKFKVTALAAAAGALLIAVPAGAHPGSNANHPSSHNNSAAHTHRCSQHKVAYIVSGTIIDGSGMTKNNDGTWSGTLTYTVTHHNHWAKADTGSATLTNVKVVFDTGATDFSTGNRVKLIGHEQVVRSKGHNVCTNSGVQPDSMSINRVVVSPPAS